MLKKIINAIGILNIIFVFSSHAIDTDFEIKGLFAGTDQKKIEIIEKIIKTGSKVYLPELGAVLDSEKNEEIRSRAVLALLTLGDSTCIPYYKKAIEDSYWQVRLYGIQGLVKYGEGALLADFMKAMKDSYWQVRYYAALGISKYGDETAVPFLVSSLKDNNDNVKGQVLWALFSLMWKDEARAAFKKLSDNQVKNIFEAAESPNPEIRIRTLWALEASGDTRAVPVFIKLLDDKNDEIKIRALWALEEFKVSEGNQQIESLLVDESTEVKLQTIRTLVRLKAAENISGIINGLSDPDETVRIFSLWALEKFKDPLSYPFVVEKLADSSPRVREYAEKLLTNIHDPVLYPVLQTFIDNDTISSDARISALTLLGKIGDETVKDFILEKTRDKNPLFRYAAVSALSNVARYDPEYLKMLAYLENYDVSPRVRQKSTSILKDIVKEFEGKLANPDKNERQFALERIESFYGAHSLTGLLLKMAYSKYPEVREKMLLMAKEAPSKVFKRSLIDLIQEPDMDIKKLAAFAIGESRCVEAVPLLRKGLRHFDPEFQLICAWALARMGIKDAFPFGVRYLQSSNIEYQKLAAEIFVFLSDKRYSNILLRSMIDSELEIKLLSAWALARMGEDKGLETLVRLSEEKIEPIRTQANKYLADTVIPQSLRKKIPALREKMQFEKLGILEIRPKMITALKTKTPIAIDGSDKDRFWQISTKENLFILLEDNKVPSGIQTKVAAGYDVNNIYFLFICDDPDVSSLTLNSRDFITVALNPLNSAEKWYQFVIHPLGDIKYSYVWKLYKNDEPEKQWSANWQVAITREKSRWVLEMAIPLKDIGVETILPGEKWSVNFQRDSQKVPLTTWTGRIDNPEQFGVINFKE